jgi:hypothetical protein
VSTRKATNGYAGACGVGETIGFGEREVLLKETVLGAARTSSVRPLLLSFHGGSPTPEPKFVSAFARCHDLGKIGIQSGTDFFEPDRVGFQLSLRTNGMELQSLQNTNQPVHVQIPEVDLRENVGFVHFRTISAARGCSSGFFVEQPLPKIVQGVGWNSGAAQSRAASDKYTRSVFS